MLKTLLACGAALVVCGSAFAAPPWTDPQPIATKDAQAPSLAFGLSGEGLASWLCCDGFGPRVPATRGAVFGSAGAPGAAFFVRRDLAVTPPVAVDRRGGVVALGYIAPRPGRTDLAAATGRLGHTLGAPRRFVPAGVALHAAATNAAGDLAVVAYMSRRAPARRTRSVVYLSTRRAGGRFSKPQLVARIKNPGRGPSLAVAISDSRHVLVAWSFRGRIKARSTGATGRLGPAVAIGAADDAAPTAALGPTGQAAIAWSSQPGGGESAPTTEGVMAVAVRAAGAGAFAPPVELERVTPHESANLLDTSGYAGPPAMAAVTGDRLLLAWTGQENDHSVIRAATVDGATVGTHQTLSSSEDAAAGPRLAAGPGGDAIVAWSEFRHGTGRPDQPNTAIRAAARPAAAAAFGPAEEIQAPVPFVTLGDLAVNPVSRRAVVTWWDSTRSAYSSRDPVGP